MSRKERSATIGGEAARPKIQGVNATLKTFQKDEDSEADSLKRYKGFQDLGGVKENEEKKIPKEELLKGIPQMNKEAGNVPSGGQDKPA